MFVCASVVVANGLGGGGVQVPYTPGRFYRHVRCCVCPLLELVESEQKNLLRSLLPSFTD